MIYKPVIILGANPAGLAAAHELAYNTQNPCPCPIIVFESGNGPGGVQQTPVSSERLSGESPEEIEFLKELLGDDLIQIEERAGFYCDGHFFDQPLDIDNILDQVNWNDGMAILKSHSAAQSRPLKEVTFQDWVINHFGEDLYQRFYEGYARKVWNAKPTELSADWAAEHLKPLEVKNTLWQMLKQTLKRPRSQRTHPHPKFYYPKAGLGQIWAKLEARLRAKKGEIEYDRTLRNIHSDDMAGPAFTHVTTQSASGRFYQSEGCVFINCLPLQDLIAAVDGPIPVEVISAGKKLRYRGQLTISFVINQRVDFPYLWVDVPSESFQVNRIVNYRNWSSHFGGDPEHTTLTAEFLFDSKLEMWTFPDESIVKFAIKDLVSTGILQESMILSAQVFRIQKAYPVEDLEQLECVKIIKQWLDGAGNIQCVGPLAMHEEQTVDRSMTTGLLASQNTLGYNHTYWVLPD